MIQRIQTVYLLLAAIVTIAGLCMPIAVIDVGGKNIAEVYNLWMSFGNGHGFFVPLIPMFVLLIFSSFIEVVTIALYKKRPMQSKFCIASMVLYILYYAVAAYALHTMTGDNVTPSLPLAFPGVSFILVILANRAIKSDEKLVRAADRLR